MRLREKDKEKNRQYQKIWWEKNKVTQTKRVKANRSKFKVWADSLKNNPCTDCGIKYPSYVMDWDHVRGIKLGNPARIAANCSKDALLEEIAKCELVCSNCHRVRTNS